MFPDPLPSGRLRFCRNRSRFRRLGNLGPTRPSNPIQTYLCSRLAQYATNSGRSRRSRSDRALRPVRRDIVSERDHSGNAVLTNLDITIVVLYLHSPVLNDVGSATAQELLSPYLDGLLRSNSGANDAGSDVQDTSAEYVVYSFVRSPARVAPDVTLSPSLMVTPNLPSDACTAGLVTALDVAVVLAEEMFWTVVGDQGKREGVEFFARGSGGADEDEED